MFSPINPDAFYEALSPDLNVLGKPQTRARLRHEGKGCPYIKIGQRVVYRGCDVLAFLEQNTVETAA